MLQFIENHLLLIIIALVVLFVVIPAIYKIFSTAIAIIVVVLLLGVLGVFGPKFFDNIKQPIAVTQSYFQNTIEPAVKNELSGAKFTYNPTTKQYDIQSSSFNLVGVSDQNKATITFKGSTYTIDVTFLQSYIQSQIAKQSATK